MVSSYNDLIRKQISDCFDVEKQTTVDNIIEFFYGLTDKEQKIVMGIALTDLYKLTYYIDGKVSDLFKLPVKEIIDRCIPDIGLTINVLEASVLFNSMDFVSKCLLLETVQDNNLDFDIYSISKSHMLDKFTYIVIDDIDKYKDYYKEYIENNKDKPDCNKIMIEYICYRMINLKFENEIKYKKYMLEFIKNYYKWKTFLIEKDSNNYFDSNDIIYLDIIKSKTLEEIIVYLEDNFDFLVTIVGGYLHTKSYNNKIHEAIVENHFELTADENIKEKLKIKEN